jgi:hypothetical protein
MSTYTKADLASLSLRDAGLYGPDEAISGADQETAETYCESLVDTLAEFGVYIPNGSVNTVPSAWLIPLASFSGLFLLKSFGGPAPTVDQVNGALVPLYKMSAKPPTGAVAEADYF